LTFARVTALKLAIQLERGRTEKVQPEFNSGLAAVRRASHTECYFAVCCFR
jgi:hypothetical protein